MNCEGYQEQISALIDEELSDEQSAEVFAHLGICPSCRTFLATTHSIRNAMAGETVQVPSSLDARLRTIARTDRWRELALSVRHGAAWWKRRLDIPVPAFALLLIMLLTSVVMILGLLRTTSPGFDTKSPNVVYIMSLSPIEVSAERVTQPARIQ